MAIDESLPTILHEVAFIPTLEYQASEEQRAEWLPLARDHKIVGCYCQTECTLCMVYTCLTVGVVGHGSNVRGLETTATYLTESEEFELHSPTLTSTKWYQ